MLEPFVDTKSHYGVIILGGGLSGVAALIQLKRKLSFTDAVIIEKGSDIGGTWRDNSYPGAGSDVPVSLYSYSFAPSTKFTSQWASQPEMSRYIHEVQQRFNVNNIMYQTAVIDCEFSNETGLWTVNMKDLVTGEVKTKTCNILISAVGALSEPNIPVLPGRELFQGEVFHSARWNHSVDLTGKKVVIVGNGCSATQIVPEIIDQVGTLTQVARSKQSILRRIPVPDGKVWNLLLKYIPGLLFLQRCLVFFVMETQFITSDITKGAKKRQMIVDDMDKYIKETAPEKYWDVLKPDFDIAAKRRVYDGNFYKALHSDKMSLHMNDVVTSLSANAAHTKNGLTIPADVIVLSTGFKVQDFLFPLVVKNGEGETLLSRWKSTNAKAFRATMTSDFPNLFTLMGPNSATGHSSVIFTTECQINMMLKLIKPILAKLPQSIDAGEKQPLLGKTPAPSVQVTKEAEDAYYQSMRSELKKKVWEKDGGVSWYVDSVSGLCTALYPWSQVSYWWNSRSPREVDFLRL